MDLVALEFEARAEKTADLGLVIDDKHGGSICVHASDALQAPAV